MSYSAYTRKTTLKAILREYSEKKRDKDIFTKTTTKLITLSATLQ